MKVWTHKYLLLSRRANRVLEGIRPEEVRTIAVIQHAALGDMMVTRPFITTLRKFFPNARITFSAVANYTQGIPEDLVHRVHIAVGKFRPRPSFRSRWRSYRELGYHDLLFDLCATSDSFWITLLNKAGLKVGFQHRLQGRLLYDVAIPRSFMKYEGESLLDQLGILRIPYDWPLDYGYPPRPPYQGTPYLLYFPTASTAFKCWEPERYGALMAQLAQALPTYEHRLLYGVKDWEREATDTALRTALEHGAVEAEPAGAGATGAGSPGKVLAMRDVKGDEFQQLVGQATLLTTNDTGVRHLAISWGVPTLGVYPISLAYTYLPRFGHHAGAWIPEGGHPPVEYVRDIALKLISEIEADPGN